MEFEAGKGQRRFLLLYKNGAATGQCKGLNQKSKSEVTTRVQLNNINIVIK
jgi:hypothetical protein